MRGRYNSDGKTEQKIELNNEEISNSITTVQKDSMVVEVKKWIFHMGKGGNYGYIYKDWNSL